MGADGAAGKKGSVLRLRDPDLKLWVPLPQGFPYACKGPAGAKAGTEAVDGKASLIQSVDSPRLLAALEKEASKLDMIQDILLEVNIGEEASKTGVSPEALWALLDDAAQQPHLRVKGLMAIPPVNEDDDANRALLRQVYGLFVRAGERGYDNVSMEVLSMGMSGDFENAIREGATLVRLGTAIYGARDYGPKA